MFLCVQPTAAPPPCRCLPCSPQEWRRSSPLFKLFTNDPLELQTKQASKKGDAGLLERTERTALLHPILTHMLRCTMYPTDTELTKAILLYAGVSSLQDFKKRYAPDFRGLSTAHPPLLQALKSKVCRQIGQTGCCICCCVACDCPACNDGTEWHALPTYASAIIRGHTLHSTTKQSTRQSTWRSLACPQLF